MIKMHEIYEISFKINKILTLTRIQRNVENNDLFFSVAVT